MGPSDPKEGREGQLDPKGLETRESYQTKLETLDRSLINKSWIA